MAGINFTDEREYQPKLTFKNNDAIHNVSNCYECNKPYDYNDKEHGMCHKCWQPIIEK